MTSLLQRYKSSTLLTIALILTGQAFSVVHAAEHGTESHEHNGVVCLAILNDEQGGLLPPPQLSVPDFIPLFSQAAPFSGYLITIQNLSLQPPATGPPSI